MKCRLSLPLSLSLMRMLFAAHFPRSRPYHPPTQAKEDLSSPFASWRMLEPHEFEISANMEDES